MVHEEVKTTDQVQEGRQKANDRLEKPPDASTVRNASGVDKQAALDAFTDKYASMGDLIAIKPNPTNRSEL